MNLVKFLENRYQEVKLESDQKVTYSPQREAEINAIHFILTSTRSTLKWAMIPKIIWNFFQVLVGWKEEPVPVLLNRARELQAEEHKKKLKKIGMVDLKANKEPEPA